MQEIIQRYHKKEVEIISKNEIQTNYYKNVKTFQENIIFWILVFHTDFLLEKKI